MSKKILIFLILTLYSQAMNYDTLKKYALKHATVLKKQRLNLSTIEEKNKILLRTQNPQLNIETAQFKSNGLNSQFGYAVTASQTIRTPSYYNAQENQTRALLLNQKAFNQQTKALYSKNFDLLYTQYVYENRQLSLFKEEYQLSAKISKMVQQQYKNGSGTKVGYLQANSATLSLKTQISTQKQRVNQFYYQLLMLAGFSTKVDFEKKFLFRISKTSQQISKETSTEALFFSQKELLASQLETQKKIFRQYNLYAGVEQEPNQTILRFGVNINIPVFNTKKEEQRLIQLKIQQISLDKSQFLRTISLKKKQLTFTISRLKEQAKGLKELKNQQRHLFNLLQEGYHISKGSVFIMIDAQRQRIQTQKSLLLTQQLFNTKTIELHFLQGAYND